MCVLSAHSEGANCHARSSRARFATLDERVACVSSVSAKCKFSIYHLRKKRNFFCFFSSCIFHFIFHLRTFLHARFMQFSHSFPFTRFRARALFCLNTNTKFPSQKFVSGKRVTCERARLLGLDRRPRVKTTLTQSHDHISRPAGD